MALTSAHSTRKVPYERLPFPLGLCWLRAVQSDSAQQVDKAAEAVVRALALLVLSDILDLPWPDDAQRKFGCDGKGGKSDLSKLSFGFCIDLLRTAISIHADQADRTLPDLQAWWRTAGDDAAKMVQARNQDTHGGKLATASATEAKARLAAFLRGATWAQTVQLLYVERCTRRSGRNHGRAIRLAGAAPFFDDKHGLDADWHADLDAGNVYLGNADGTRWTLCPFVHVEGRHIAVLTAVTTKGHLQFVDIDAATHAAPTLLPGVPVPDKDWELVAWPAFLQVRQEAAAGYRTTQPARFDKLKLEAPADLALVVGGQVGNFRLVQLLGQGGFASVWEVEDVHTGDVRALKVLLPESAERDSDIERFKKEVEHLRRLHREGCRHILGPVDGRTELVGGEPRQVLVMPLLQGTLSQQAQARQVGGTPVTEVELVDWAVQCLQGLGDLHARQVVHRDIKPSNLLLDAQERIVIADFGVARVVDRKSDLTRTNDVVGSDRYMPDEQRQRPKTVTGKADVFALARTLHEVLTGTYSPWAGKGVEGKTGEMLRRMAAADPDDRPTAGEAEAEFAKVLAELRPVVVPEPVAAPVPVVRESPGLRKYRLELKGFLTSAEGLTAAGRARLAVIAEIADLDAGVCEAVAAESL